MARSHVILVFDDSYVGRDPLRERWEGSRN
jgi:hypothetical protein